MFDNRGLLALICVGLGAILVIAAALRKADRSGKAPSPLVWVYAAMFFVLAAVLWKRESEGPIRPDVPGNEISERTQPAEQKEQETSQQPDRPGLPDKHDPADTKTAESVRSSSGMSDPDHTGTSNVSDQRGLTPKVSQFVYEKTGTGEPSSHPDQTSQTATDQGIDVELPSEEEIYGAVAYAFDTIERWFDRNAWSAPVTRVSPVASAKSPQQAKTTSRTLPSRTDSQFPVVAFYTGTADITMESQEGLRNLASWLLEQPSAGVLEIQARIDSIGPEAFNHILTHARAVAVCNFLIAEGVPAERLVAVGLGSAEDSTRVSKTDIEFVMRH